MKVQRHGFTHSGDLQGEASLMEGGVRHKGQRTLVKLPLHVNKEERPCPVTDALANT